MRLLRPVLVLAAGYAALCALVFVFQRRLSFAPGPPPLATPAALGLDFDELELATADGERLQAWLVRAPRAGPAGERALVLHCHGNAGNVEGRIPAAAALAALGFDTLLFDYRGFGASTGSPSEAGTYLDAEAAWDAAVARGYRPERIALFGESLGGGVATELARRRGAAALVLESTFTSLPDVGARVYPWLPVRLLCLDRYDNLAKLPALRLPLLVLHAPGDALVPFEHGRRLAGAAGAELVELPGGHDDGGFLQREDLRRRVGDFLAAAIGGPALRADAAGQ